MDELVHFALTLPKLILSMRLCSGQVESTELLNAAEPGLSPSTASSFSPHGLSRVSGGKVSACAQAIHVCLKWEFDQRQEIAKDVVVAATVGKISLTGASFLMA